uniref:Aldehyde oxidase/xanthine dehydrogenase a/b hammerhead domain-containing protein n=1 Tax=Tetraodon nigroviridis TaxID=99883 RepID=H3C6R3_TETNG
MTHLNAPRMNKPAVFGSSPTAAGPADLPVMQDDRVHWNGQPIALVLAETQEQADHAVSLIVPTYATEPSTTSFEAAKAAGPQPGLFMGQPLLNEIGDADAMLAAAPHKVDHVYRTPPHNHNAIEPHAATITWVGNDWIVHDASQLVTAAAQTIGDVFDLKAGQVRLTSPFVGGGFGGKCLWDHQILGAARQSWPGRPVRITLSREGVYRIVGGRTLTEQRVAIGADADGRFKALIHTGVAVMTPHNNMPEPFILGTRGGYAADSFKLSVETVTMNMLANTFMRAPGESVGTFALESAIDELAIDLDMDPICVRIRNEPDKDPTSGLPFSERSAQPGTCREGEWLVGMGARPGPIPITGCRGQPRGSRARLPLDRVSVNYGDSIIPGAILAGGSQQTAAIGAAVIAAHHALVAELLKLAGNDSPLAGLSPGEVGSEGGGLTKLDDPSRRESYVSILERAQRDSIVVTEEASQPLELMHWSMHSHSALFCEVRVNAVTGETRVSRSFQHTGRAGTR